MEVVSKLSFEVVAPVFLVTDIVRSSAYYVDQLGFQVHFEWADENEDKSRYVILSKGKTELHLSQSDQARPAIAYFFVNAVQDYYDITKNTDALITEHIQDFPWGMREFEVKDLDGNKMVFGEHVSRFKAKTGT